MAFQNVLLKKNEKEHAVALATTSLQNRYDIYSIIARFVIVFTVKHPVYGLLVCIAIPMQTFAKSIIGDFYVLKQANFDL